MFAESLISFRLLNFQQTDLIYLCLPVYTYGKTLQRENVQWRNQGPQAELYLQIDFYRILDENEKVSGSVMKEEEKRKNV